MAPLFSCFVAAIGASLVLGTTSAETPDVALPFALRSGAVTWPVRDSQRSAVWTPEFKAQLDVSSPRRPEDDTAAISGGDGQISIVLHNLGDLVYYGEISLGTPPQVFNMSFDTMTSDFWVPNVSIGVHHGYIHDASSTYQANGAGFYSPYVTGIVSQDVLRIGDATLPGQYFGETSDTSRMGPGYPTSPVDGVFGFGFDSKSVVPMETPLHRLVREKLIDRAMFGLFCGRHLADGELTLGGVNRRHFKGDLHYVDVVSKAYWLVALTSIKAGGVTVDEGADLLVSTMSDFILGPSDAVERIAMVVGATEYESTGMYWINCAAEPSDIVFVLSGREFAISKDEYIVQMDGPHKCWLAFLKGGATWILGTPFYHRYYTAFDMDALVPRIGFAPAV